ncbi:MAG TPA: FtsW/RodA/SpoVE family cell cycle protein [Anaerolineales bacterium]
MSLKKHQHRSTEALLLLPVLVIAVLGFGMVAAALRTRQQEDPLSAFPEALVPPILFGLVFILVHILMWLRRSGVEQIVLPVVGLLLAIGLIMIYRLSGPQGVWQQLIRGFLPGVLLMSLLIIRPNLIERLRRWAIPISLLGLALPIATALFGVVDETGARLALKIGPLPAIQTSEIIKVALLIFLAWYIERQGRVVEGRARPIFRWLRLPAVRYFIPGALFVATATLALVQMSDFGAVLILGGLYIAMLYAGFETRVFATVAAAGLGLGLIVGLILAFAWDLPAVIQYRFLAYRDPWSEAMVFADGQPTGVTISQGPGYQIQQAIYATIAGGITGQGLGFGSPQYIPLAHSDFIFAAILEELGAVIGIAVLILFAILILRILRIAALLPSGQIFERLLLVGIAVHIFMQVFVMVSGTLNLLPMTGVTIPFLSQGGVALMVNLTEIGIVIALAQRLEVDIA